MTTLHRPDPEFVESLLGRVESEWDRPLRLPPARRFPRVSVLVLGAALLLLVGAGTAQILPSGERELLVQRHRLLVERAEKRRERLAERLGEVERAREAGLVADDDVARARLGVASAEVRLARARRDLEEVQATGERPRDELAAPKVGDRDFVAERLDLERKAVELRRREEEAAEDRSRRLDTSGFAGREDFERSQKLLETKWMDYRNKADIKEHEIRKLLEKHGTDRATLDFRREDLRRRMTEYRDRIDELEVELAAKRAPEGRADPRVEEDADVREWVEKLKEARSRRAKMEGAFLPESPTLKEAEDEVARCAARLERARVASLNRLLAEREETARARDAYAEKLAAAEAEYRADAELIRKLEPFAADAARYDEESRKYYALWEKLQDRREQAELEVDAEPGPGPRPARAAKELEDVDRRIALRAAFLAGKETAERTELLGERSRVLLRRELAELSLAAARAALDRVRRQHSVGLATVAEVREDEAAVLDLEAESRVAEIDLQILDQRLGGK